MNTINSDLLIGIIKTAIEKNESDLRNGLEFSEADLRVRRIKKFTEIIDKLVAAENEKLLDGGNFDVTVTSSGPIDNGPTNPEQAKGPVSVLSIKFNDGAVIVTKQGIVAIPARKISGSFYVIRGVDNWFEDESVTMLCSLSDYSSASVAVEAVKKLLAPALTIKCTGTVVLHQGRIAGYR